VRKRYDGWGRRRTAWQLLPRLASLVPVRALEGGGPIRGRHLGRAVGLSLLLVALLFAAAAFVGARGLPAGSGLASLAPRGVASRSTTAPSALASPQTAPSATSSETLAAAQAIVAPAAAPQRLLVPAIGVNASVEPLGLDTQGRMATPSRAENVGWYSPGATPGDVGNAVIDGHLDWTTGPAVFWKLGRLRHGDEITITRADGSQAKFAVQSTSVMPYDASTDLLFTRSGPPSLILVTCSGSWDRQRGTYLQRLVVRASLVSSAPAKPVAGAGP
jgi:sortase (surface protein transpeptidase)